MSAGADLIREQGIAMMDIARRRWKLFLVPVVIAIALALLAVRFAPTKYVAESLVLLSGANRSVAALNSNNSWQQRASAVEQVNAIEAWLKSDQVLAPLLPRLSGYKPATEPGARVGQMRAFRNALSLELVGGSVLQIRLEGSKPKGLGRDLEIILSRLMEGLTGPEQNIFSAPQFVLMQRGDELAAADAALDNAIHASGTNDPAAVIRDLRQLSGMTTGSLPGMRSSGASQVDPQAVEELRRRISNDPSVSRHLEQLYAARQRAQAALDAMRSQAGGRSNYVGIFDAPDNLLVIGRPADPVVGESKGRKLAIAGVLASILLGAALVFAVEFLAGPLRTRKDFEDALGVPVIARVGHLPNGSDAPPAQSA